MDREVHLPCWSIIDRATQTDYKIMKFQKAQSSTLNVQMSMLYIHFSAIANFNISYVYFIHRVFTHKHILQHSKYIYIYRTLRGEREILKYKFL